MPDTKITSADSDQIAKAREQLTARAIEFFDKLPHCIGYPGCDGDLEGMPHEPGCPLFTQKEMTLREKVVTFAASERQAVIEECAKVVCFMCKDRERWNPAEVIEGSWEHGLKNRSSLTAACNAAAIRSME